MYFCITVMRKMKIQQKSSTKLEGNIQTYYGYKEIVIGTMGGNGSKAGYIILKC